MDTSGATTYRCAVCGKPATVTVQGKAERECEHADAGVIASASATVYGKGRTAS